MVQRRTQSFPIAMPTLGVNKNCPPGFLDRTESPDAWNVRYDNGEIGPRPGTQLLGHASGTEMPFAEAAGDTVVMHFDVFHSISGARTLVCATAENLYYYNAAANTWVELVAHAGIWSGDVTKPYSSCHIGHDGSGAHAGTWYLVICTQTDDIYIWDGDTSSPEFEKLTGGDAYQTPANHKARQIFSFKNSLFLLAPYVDAVQQTKTLYWCSTGDIDEWDFTTTNAGFEILVDTPGDLQWALQLGDRMAIYKTDSVILGTHTGGAQLLFRHDTALRGIGLLASGLLGGIEGEHVFFSRNNIWRWNGVEIPRPKGDYPIYVNGKKKKMGVWNYFKNNANGDSLGSCRTFDDKSAGQLNFFFPAGSDTQANHCLTYDYQEDYFVFDEYRHKVTAIGNWTSFTGLTWDGVPADSSHNWDDYYEVTWQSLTPTEGEDATVLGDEAGKTYERSFSYLTDNGELITFNHTFPPIVIDPKAYLGRWVEYMGLEYEGRGWDFNWQYSLDEGDNWTNLRYDRSGFSYVYEYSWNREYFEPHSIVTNKPFWLRIHSAYKPFYIRELNLLYVPRGRDR